MTTEADKKSSFFDTAKAYGALGLTAVGGLFLLAKVGIVGGLFLGGLATAGVATYAAVNGESPLAAVKSTFSKIGGFYKNALSIAKKGFSGAAEWAEEHEAKRDVAADGAAPTVGSAESKADFSAAALKATKAQTVAVTPKAKPAAPKREGLGG